MSEIPDSTAVTPAHQFDLPRQLAELEALRQRLTEKEALLHQAIEAGGLSAWHWDFRTHHFTMVDNLASPPTVYNNAPISEWEALIHPDDLPGFQARIPRMMVGDMPAHPQYRIRLPNHEYIWVEAHCDLIRDETDTIIGMTGVMVNITRRKEAEQRDLELALLQRKHAFLTEFLSTISHDFKTPISVMNTTLYLMQHALDNQDPPARLSQLIDAMKNQTAHLEKYLLDIITFSRLEHAPPIRHVTVNLAELLTEVVNHLRPAAEQKRLDFRLDFQMDAPATCTIQADDTELHRAFVNLVENAIHYTPANGTVIIRLIPQPNAVVVEVQDTGIGIHTADLTNIFTRFYRSEAARQFSMSGTGLGLAIVKKIIEMHNGTILVESTPDAGSLFRVTLPQRQPEN